MIKRKNYRAYLKDNGIPIKYDLQNREDLLLFRNNGAKQYNQLYDFLNLSKEAKILEVGFHYGAFIEYVNSKDIIPDAIELDERKYDMLVDDPTIKANFFVGDANAFLKDKSHCYDYVFLNYVLEHIEPSLCISVLKSIQRSLKKGGMLLATVPNMENPYNLRLMYCEPTHVNGFTTEKLIWAFYNSGFDEIVCKDPHEYNLEKFKKIQEYYNNIAELMEIRRFNGKNSETLLCYGKKLFEHCDLEYGPYDF